MTSQLLYPTSLSLVRTRRILVLTRDVAGISLNRGDVMISLAGRVPDQRGREFNNPLSNPSSFEVVAADQCIGCTAPEHFLRLQDYGEAPRQGKGVCDARVKALTSIDGVDVSGVASQENTTDAAFGDKGGSDTLLD